VSPLPPDGLLAAHLGSAEAADAWRRDEAVREAERERRLFERSRRGALPQRAVEPATVNVDALAERLLRVLRPAINTLVREAVDEVLGELRRGRQT
jgi:hypothetical protein